MIIGVDIRSLMDRQYSGVSMYAFNLLNALFKIDKDNEYRLFYNGFKIPLDPHLIKRETDAGRTHWTNRNIEFYGSCVPNKIFNASTAFLNFPKIDKMLKKSPLTPLWKRGEQKIDIFFSPNFIFTSLSEYCKKIVTAHDLSFERCPRFYSLKGRLWHKFVKTRKMCKEADLIIAVSENTKYDIMELYGISERKIRVVYSGAGQDRTDRTNKTISTDRTYNLPQKYILFLGNVENRKNVLGVIKAFQRLNEAYGICDYDLVIAGQKGFGFNYIELEIKNLKLPACADKGIKNKIKFLDYIDENIKADLYRNASLFVYPSFYEGFGFPPLEAMSYGCPVITSNCSSLSEIVGDSSIMADPYNVADIANAMVKILTDEKLCSLMIQRGFERVKQFSWEKCARETLRIFQELAGLRDCPKSTSRHKK